MAGNVLPDSGWPDRRNGRGHLLGVATVWPLVTVRPIKTVRPRVAVRREANLTFWISQVEAFPNKVAPLQAIHKQ